MNERLDDTRIQKTIRGYQNMIGMLKVTGYILILAAVGIVGIVIGLAYFVRIPIQYGTIYSYLMMILFVIIALIIINAIIRNKQKKKYKAFVGTHILTGILADQIELNQYFFEPAKEPYWIKECSILPNYNKMRGNDYIRGRYRGVELEYCDLLLLSESDDGMETVFKGSLLKLSMKRSIAGYIKIKKRKIPRRDNGFLSGMIKSVTDTLGIKASEVSIEVEHGIFRMNFDVRTNNSKIAYDFLSPEYVECIIAIDNICGGCTSLEIKGNNIYIASNNGYDSFEIDKQIKGEKSLEKIQERFNRDLGRILAVIDKMKEAEDY